MNQRRLLWQLFPVNLLIILGTVIFVTWYGSTIVRSLSVEQTFSDLTSRAYLINNRIADLIASPAQLQLFCRQTGKKASTRITVIAPDGKVLADSDEDPARMDNHANRPELKVASQGKIGSSMRYSRTLSKYMIYTAIPLYGTDRRIKALLRLAVPEISIDRALQAINLKIFVASVIIILVAALISLYVSRRIVQPLEEMKRGAERMARGDTETLIEIDTAHTSSEVDALAKSLNRMAMQIKERISTITMQHNELETVFSSMADMVLAVDTETKIIRINRSAAALFYLSPDDMEGKMLQGVIRNKELLEIVDEVLATDSPLERDIVVFVGVEKTYLHTRAESLRDENNKLMGVLVVMNDMTRLHKLENLRRDFVANVSHELKTPITAIQGYVETLLDGAFDKPQDARRFLEIIVRQTSRLDAIIDDLLMLSRIELKTEHHQIILTEVRLKDVLESVIQTCKGKAEEKNIRLTLSCDENITSMLNPNLIEQAVINLITNAITYSPANTTVTVSAAVQTQPEIKDRLVIRVEDQGIGIEQKHLERLFERFYRTDKARSSASGGTGLGLSIVKHIAIAHKGTVTVESEPGKGSAFSLILPR